MPKSTRQPPQPTQSSIAIALASLPYDPMARFGLHLAELRRAQGMSQESLALDSGLARSYLGGVERGQRNIALVNICRLAEALALALALTAALVGALARWLAPQVADLLVLVWGLPGCSGPAH